MSLKQVILISASAIIIFIGLSAKHSSASAVAIGDPCASDADCSSIGQAVGCVEIQGQKKCAPVCQNNSDCAAGLVCEQRQCALPAEKRCQSDANCPVSQNICDNGECKIISCLGHANCPDGRFCSTNVPAGAIGAGTGFCQKKITEPAKIEKELPFQEIKPTLEIPIPGLQFSNITIKTKEGERYLDIPYLAEYIAGLYKYLLGIVGTIAIVMVMFGGLKWLTAGGNPSKIGAARETIGGAIIGLILAVGSYLILWTINPELVSFESWKRNLSLRYIKPEYHLGKPGGGLGAGNPLLDQYNNMACPQKPADLSQPLELKVFTTGYYKPPFGEKSVYDSFECNVAMQCLCPGDLDPKTGKQTLAGREPEASCMYKDIIAWRPCKKIESGTDYCTKTSAGTVPTPNKTVAASECFKKGCKITIGGTTYEVEDTGSAIKGLHLDVFTGSLEDAKKITGEKDASLDPASCF